METVTPAGLPPPDAPAPDVTGPDVTPAGLPPRPAATPDVPVTPAGLPPRTGNAMSPGGVVVAALAGVGLASLVAGAGRLWPRRFPEALPSGRSGEL